MIRAKICGLTSADAAQTAAEGGATDLGFIHFPKSPRHLSVAAAGALEASLPKGPRRVGVLVNPSIDAIKPFADALKLDAIQLHGQETPEFAEQVKRETGLLIYKAFPVAEARDLEQSRHFEGVAEAFLFDAKPPKGSDLPGGNAHSFPWGLMRGFETQTPWYLAGGLTPSNVAEAIHQAAAPGVDVSSGTEDAPGKKSLSKIRDFLQAAQSAR